jgi:hypothetical protein
MLPSTVLGVLLGLLVVPSRAATAAGDSYDETLLLQSLPDGKVHSRFSFTLAGPWDDVGLSMGDNVQGERRVRARRRVPSLTFISHN